MSVDKREFVQKFLNDHYPNNHEAETSSNALKKYKSNQSLNSIWSLNSYLSEDARAALKSAKETDKKKTDDQEQIESDKETDEEKIYDQEAQQYTVDSQQHADYILNKIKGLQQQPKNFDTKRKIFGLLRQYKTIVKSPNLYYPHDDDDEVTTATITVTKIHFPRIAAKFGQRNFFLLVTYGYCVHVSEFITTEKRFLTFEDVFQFENVRSDFAIKVQLYAITMKAKIQNFIKNTVVPKNWSNRKLNISSIESSSFQLLEEFQIYSNDVRPNSRFGTIMKKSNDYRFSLNIEDVHINLMKCDFIDVFDNVDQLWIQCWCRIRNEQFEIYQNQDDLQPMKMFNLRYCTVGKIFDNLLVFKIVRPKTDNDSHLITLRSRSNFVFEELKLCSIDKDCLKSWKDALNDIVESLVRFKYSFLTFEEVYM